MSDSPLSDDTRTLVRAYHELSKHRFDAYAPGPASLNWDATHRSAQTAHLSL